MRATFLIFVFCLFLAVGIIFLVIPTPIMIGENRIERDVTVNIGTDSLFLALTTIMIDGLLTARQNHEWKLVKDKMIEKLRNVINGLLAILFNLCEIPSVKREDVLAELAKLDRIAMRKDILEYFLKDDYMTQLNLDGYIEWFQGAKKSLNDIRVEYSGFIEHELMESLIVLEDKCGEMANYFRLLKRVDLTRAREEKFEELYFGDLIALIVQEVMKEIQKVSRSGVKISIPRDFRFNRVVPWERHLESLFEQVLKYEPIRTCTKCDKRITIADASFCPYCGKELED